MEGNPFRLKTSYTVEGTVEVTCPSQDPSFYKAKVDCPDTPVTQQTIDKDESEPRCLRSAVHNHLPS